MVWLRLVHTDRKTHAFILTEVGKNKNSFDGIFSFSY